MPRAWKRSADKRTKGAPWRLTYWDAEQQRERTRRGYTDKEQTLALGRKLEDEARARADGLVDAGAEAARHAASISVTDHVKAFIMQLESNGRTPRYVSQVNQRLSTFLEYARIDRINAITADHVATFVGHLRSDLKMSDFTVGEYVGNLKAFTKWAVLNGKLLTDPLRTLRKPSRAAATRTRQRRAITADEVGRLLDAAARRPELELRTIRTGPDKGKPLAKVKKSALIRARKLGEERALAYLLAIWTGLRRAELAALAWGDVIIDTLPERINLRAETTKSRRADSLALHPQVAEHLRAHRPAEAADHHRVLSAVPSMAVLRRDLELAGIEDETARGRIDFHAMRMGLATLLASAGVPQRIAQQHLRHTDPRLTSNVYTDQHVLPVANAIASLPPLPTTPDHHSQATEAAALRQTGTETTPAGAQRHAQRGGVTEGQNGARSDTPGPKTQQAGSGDKVAAGQDLAPSGSKRVRRFERPTFTLA
ncbi:MAG: tyrosine-type recombinase/integrase, partial [Phycisphaerales bacterium]|nr:tyrosine-type recombinase/integrase [Phycisphaerales bacterium]